MAKFTSSAFNKRPVPRLPGGCGGDDDCGIVQWRRGL